MSKIPDYFVGFDPLYSDSMVTIDYETGHTYPNMPSKFEIELFNKQVDKRNALMDKIYSVKCECGGDSSGCLTHSTWCPKYESVQ